jgi:hypothetical protein
MLIVGCQRPRLAARRHFLNWRRCAPNVALSFGLVLALIGPAAAQPLELDFQDHGLENLNFSGVPLLKSGHPRLRRIVWDDTGATLSLAGSDLPSSTYDEKTRRLEQTWNMGRLTCVYRPQAERLQLEIAFTNTSDRPIRYLELAALHFAFPATPTGLGWYRDMHCTSDSIDDAAAVIASYGKGTVVAVNDAFDHEVRLAFQKDFERPANGYNLIVATINKTATDFVHADPPDLKPRRTITFQLSLRFGPAKSGLLELADDEFVRYGERFPRVLEWSDRRPISMLMLASGSAQHHSDTNPRAWLNDPTIDVTTLGGRDRFKSRLLDWADFSVLQCRQRGAQGVIVWDVEGQEFHPIVYVGDPRMVSRLAPELDAIADEFFKKFTDAGLRTGVCIRPSRIARRETAKNGSPWWHHHMAFDPVKEMSEKIAYAKKRWGCSLYYVDSNMTYAYPDKERELARAEPESWTMRADAMRRLAKLHPDTLIIPELQYTGYYSHVSGYKELRGGFASTPRRVLLAYPRAFSVINVADGNIAGRRDELVAAVKRGDILLFRGWYESPESAAVQSIYREAGKDASPEPRVSAP